MSKVNKYRSGLEKALAEKLPPDEFKYEPYSIPYTMYRNYTPDFVCGNYLIECKGFFRAGDVMKYKSIRDSDTEKQLVFVLSDKNKKVRKGSKMNMSQWCDKEGFPCYTVGEYKEMVDFIRSNPV